MLREGHLNSVTLLMKHGADPLALDARGQSCIHVAAQYGHFDIVAYFVAKGVNIDKQDSYGMTPLMWCARKVKR
jgi:ankyrin repeat protein